MSPESQPWQAFGAKNLALVASLALALSLPAWPSAPEAAAGELAGRWKSTSGNLFSIEQAGDQVKITNLTSPRCLYQLEWDHGLLLGFVQGCGSHIVIALKPADRGHLHCFTVRLQKNWDRLRMRTEAERGLRRPQTVWTRKR